ncbi:MULTISPECIES: GntR family transcriptional regulator [Rhizobium]|uniref:GntR family transcriptional regulator n=1 Tax=Rhizobium TaxID=379 RepID=UPI001A8CA006|nr:MULTISPECIES: GntR family transcriptional regulator [Rhizobium]MBN9987627.1 GntR family transcriptional regulator [Rhizobium laguerreae]MBY2945271.1 GntR family transcriptional regulator [Rhizobium leguminosarum]
MARAAVALKKETPRAAPSRGQAAEIHRVLRDRICLLRYRPGEFLVETELATEFNVSRTPIRQALQRLDYEGLVETKNGIGTTVTGVDFQEFKDVYAFRLRLSEMIGDFCRTDRTKESLGEVEALVPRVEALLESRNFEQFWQINHELHFAVNSLIGNSAMRESHDRLYYQASRVWYSFVDRMWEDEVRFLNAEVDELCRAMRAGDLRAVGFVQRNYISYGLSRVARYISTG